jgi:predicted phosphodiesterase
MPDLQCAARVAALFDVHGNLPALEAVLAEVSREPVDLAVFGGDLVWGPWPAETLALAQSLGARARFLHGNCETLVSTGASTAHRWARGRLTRAQLDTIASWPRTLSIEIEGLGPTLFCHATPRSEEEILTPESPVEAWSGALAGIPERTVVCGHTHLPFDRTVAGVRVVNPGSVGAPTVRPAAWWAVLGPDVRLRVTEYDTEAAIAAASRHLPDTRGLVYWLRHPPSYEERVATLTRQT